jgi:hypothetical protein
MGYFSFGTLDFPSEKRTKDYCLIPTNQNDCKLFKIDRITNYVINNAIFLFITVLLDLILFYSYNEQMMKKKKICNNFNEEDSNNMKQKLTKMIIINGVIFIISHFPELIVLVLLYVFEDEMFNFCSNQMTCDKLNEIVQFFTFISIIAQLFIFNIFNKHFNMSLKDLLKNFQTKSASNTKSQVSTSEK